MSTNVIRWCMLSTVCYQCRRVLWLVRAVERVLRLPLVVGAPDIFVRHCLVCVALEAK